jgi:DNA repair photolyase
MDITAITVKSALIRSKIPGVDYVINPYLGCAHGCRYCYAVFMRRYSRHHSVAPWGSFVEVKVNLLDILRAELRRKKQPGRALLASVCDPYQPVEARFRLTRGCLEILREHHWGIEILTRSPLVNRDLDILRDVPKVSVGFSIPTDDDRVRYLLEPQAPPIPVRLQALAQVHAAGLHTWVFVAPLLPMQPERLFEAVAPHIDHLMVDRFYYSQQVQAIFQKHGWDYALSDNYARETGARLLKRWENRGSLS